MVMLLMIAFFHEQFSMITACSIVLAVAGVALLSIGGDSSRPVTLLGVGMMLLSGFCNALYITGIHVAGIRNMNGLVMTFYVLFFGAAFAFANAVGTGTFQPLSSWWEFMMAALLAVITAVLSNLTLVLVKSLGKRWGGKEKAFCRKASPPLPTFFPTTQKSPLSNTGRRAR